MGIQVYWQRIPLAVKILTAGVVAVTTVVMLRPTSQPLPAVPVLPTQVQVMAADPRPQALTVKTQGTVAPRREIDLVTRVAGNIQSAAGNFVDGGFFAAGETLIKIDDRDYQFALVRATARVREAEQALATERGRARQAQREWRDLGNAEANALFLRKPQLAAAEATLDSARAERDQARLDFERTTISVPFAGRVRETYVDLGQYVSPGTKIAKVYDTSLAEIRLPLTDRQAALVDLPLGFRGNADEPGPAVTISGVIAGQRYRWQGRIVRTDASVDVRSRLYYAVAEVLDPFVADPATAQVPLVVGLFVEAEISGRQLPGVITLPKQALFKRNHVYTLDKEQRVELKTVTVLHSDAEWAWVRGDLAPGELVVTDKQAYLQPGLVVAPRTTLEETRVVGDGTSGQPGPGAGASRQALPLQAGSRAGN
ncbi:efflux RND transporter periplasmic adaptor subunit [Exilibacterium tricleocarpae]|uniref:Efflux RND transporter periplasmic adaptor subunit n=1 Tax=Exilibacterium tricleocarpae TaxID=2591008 RepID=A0A545TYX6_9GAMM|nr:efflux RND transporter periplasmic adaptor subunit [Exilibacterium tricleocarpae]TQV82411.1 efflux RND transporter periplasmic adaptor subunit [Exilibacterium tricleocarpae]